jgi:hypothetical protein
MFRKSFLLGVCFVFIFSMVFVYGDDAEIQRLRAQGQKEGWTFTVGKTSVSDIPLENLCGLVIPKNWKKKGNFDGGAPEGLLALPSSFDWRDYGKVTSVKNQGSCGSCWDFATIGSYESAILVSGGPSENLSEQWLLDCNSQGYSCSGGWLDGFSNMYNGVPRESCYPYVAYKQSCKTSCTKYHPMDAWYYVGNSSSVPSTTDLKNAIYNQGGIAVAVYANSAMQNYTGGIFNSCASYSPNHAVMLVGWNDSGGYWIMKNSWGTGWGESGYMRIPYGCSNIGYSASYGIPEGGTPPPEDPYEPNDSAGTAYGPINSGENYTDAEISTSSDVDWFHFTIDDTGTITVSVDHESGEDLDWYLYHSSDTSNWLARGYTLNDPEVGSYSATTTGKYYVKVVGYNGSTSTYTLNVTYPTGGGPGPTGYYRFMNRYSGYAMDVNSGSNYVYHYTYNGNTDKHWEIIDLENGYYRIDNRSSGYSLDTGSGNYTYQYTWNGNTDKHWQIIDLGNGYYRLDNRYNGRSLDVGSSSYVYNYTWNGNTDKQWQIIEID